MKPTQEQVIENINSHVLYDVSELVYNLAQDEKYMGESLSSILSKPDYETPARDNGFTVEIEHDNFYLHNTIHSVNSSWFDTATEAWEYACNLEDIEPYLDEAYEHWIVSEWLADQLEKHDEMINRDFLGLTIWGRCNTGQAIHLDGVMVEITATLI